MNQMKIVWRVSKLCIFTHLSMHALKKFHWYAKGKGSLTAWNDKGKIDVSSEGPEYTTYTGNVSSRKFHHLFCYTLFWFSDGSLVNIQDGSWYKFNVSEDYRYNEKHRQALCKVCITSTNKKTSKKTVCVSVICILDMFHCYNNYTIKKLMKD